MPNIYIEPTLLARVDAAALADQRSRSSWVGIALERMLDGPRFPVREVMPTAVVLDDPKRRGVVVAPPEDALPPTVVRGSEIPPRLYACPTVGCDLRDATSPNAVCPKHGRRVR